MKIKSDRLRRISAEKDVLDTREIALDLMLRALELLDKDPGISPLVGPQLQLAIDRLAYSKPQDPCAWRTAASTF
ncbi:hypothetical protein LZ496_13015 [Sphingomonas sp. NSE70-1]|uniref:Uncharacterized protein n=1 Tax=Sphingomonas caseinilyticus TaxID=2908205 RepID=A0ABT0RXZ2_9SPHN|nr:hypothetical protein [Sphingomonas caseinilyticus]MCL6699698.1 hypothetical protein [Sphingomonas caseinilyticus]